MADKFLKQLEKHYAMECSQLFEYNIVELFLLNLTCMRDKILFMKKLPLEESSQNSLATLFEALQEYKTYNFYTALPQAQLSDSQQQEKLNHWNTFWELVKNNISSWEELYATI